MSEYNTQEKRKEAFLKEYDTKDDIVQVAKALNINVNAFKSDDGIRGAIAYLENKFEIFINTKIVNTLNEYNNIVIHELSHWIFDYDEVKKRPFFDRDGDCLPDIEDLEAELRAMNFTDLMIERKKRKKMLRNKQLINKQYVSK